MIPYAVIFTKYLHFYPLLAGLFQRGRMTASQTRSSCCHHDPQTTLSTITCRGTIPKSPKDAYDYHSERFRIETFFSDQKSRGFNIHKSHISDPVRLNRLMIAACLAYIWIIFLGTTHFSYTLSRKPKPIIRTADNCFRHVFIFHITFLRL